MVPLFVSTVWKFTHHSVSFWFYDLLWSSSHYGSCLRWPFGLWLYEHNVLFSNLFQYFLFSLTELFFFFFPFFCLNFAGWSSKRAKNYKAMWICCQEPYSGSKGDLFFIFYLALPNIFFSSHAISARESLEEK